MIDYQRLLPEVIAIARQAGAVILAHYQSVTPVNIELKSDSSPVTLADRMADEVIIRGLQQLSPHWPILTEEQPIPALAMRQQWEHFWCVDPLDGTRGFINKTDDFVVSIALVAHHQPVLGVIYVPIEDVVYYSCQGSESYKQAGLASPVPVSTRKMEPAQITVALSRAHRSERMAGFLQQFPGLQQISMGSAVKSCFVAEGRVDLYPRLGPTFAWDTAAAQCIVEQAGGQIIDLHGQPLRYNTQDSLLNPSFLVVGDPTYDWLQKFAFLKNENS